MVTVIPTLSGVERLNTLRKLAVKLEYPEPICTLNTNRRVTAFNTSAVCRIDTPAPPPTPTDSGLAITVIAERALLTGQPVCITPTGTLDKANSQGLSCVGLALADTNAGREVAYISEGGVTQQDWAVLTGQPYLIPGAVYYLLGSGMLTHIPPVAGLSQQIGVAVSRHTLDVEIRQAIQLAGA